MRGFTFFRVLSAGFRTYVRTTVFIYLFIYFLVSGRLFAAVGVLNTFWCSVALKNMWVYGFILQNGLRRDISRTEILKGDFLFDMYSSSIK